MGLNRTTDFCERHRKKGWGGYSQIIREDPSIADMVAGLILLREEVVNGIHG